MLITKQQPFNKITVCFFHLHQTSQTKSIYRIPEWISRAGARPYEFPGTEESYIFTLPIISVYYSAITLTKGTRWKSTEQSIKTSFDRHVGSQGDLATSSNRKTRGTVRSFTETECSASPHKGRERGLLSQKPLSLLEKRRVAKRRRLIARQVHRVYCFGWPPIFFALSIPADAADKGTTIRSGEKEARENRSELRDSDGLWSSEALQHLVTNAQF